MYNLRTSEQTRGSTTNKAMECFGKGKYLHSINYTNNTRRQSCHRLDVLWNPMQHNLCSVLMLQQGKLAWLWQNRYLAYRSDVEHLILDRVSLDRWEEL